MTEKDLKSKIQALHHQLKMTKVSQQRIKYNLYFRWQLRPTWRYKLLGLSFLTGFFLSRKASFGFFNIYSLLELALTKLPNTKFPPEP